MRNGFKLGLCLILVSCTISTEKREDDKLKVICPGYKLESNSSMLMKDEFGRHLLVKGNYLVVIPPTCVIMIPLQRHGLGGNNERPEGI